MGLRSRIASGSLMAGSSVLAFADSAGPRTPAVDLPVLAFGIGGAAFTAYVSRLASPAAGGEEASADARQGRVSDD